LVFTFLIANCELTQAQKNITLEESINTALQNNLKVKIEKLNTEYQKKLVASAINIPQTNLIGEYGQINSAYNDTKFGISQSFSFPVVYSRQKSLQNGSYKVGVLNVALQEAELKKEVSTLFYCLLYLQQKQKILLRTDSIYSAFKERTDLRFEQGESNILEKSTAENLRGQIGLQLSQLQVDMDIMQIQFQILLNTDSVLTPQNSNFKLSFDDVPDTNAIVNHPMIKVFQEEMSLSFLSTKLERSKLYPDLHIGYSNMSNQGTGADNVLYNSSTRFSSVQFGLGLPLFFWSQKAKINSSKLQELMSENKYQIELQNFKSEYQSSFKQYQENFNAVKYYEEIALKNANVLVDAANLQFTNGDINYLEWAMLINNSTTIQSNYLDAVKDLNNSIIQLNYLTTK
jgi:heavy metal efflux system protein